MFCPSASRYGVATGDQSWDGAWERLAESQQDRFEVEMVDDCLVGYTKAARRAKEERECLVRCVRRGACGTTKALEGIEAS